MELTVHKEVQEQTTTFILKGMLDISTSKVIEPYLNDIGDIKVLILDFSELEFIDSTGIGSIIDAIYLSQEKNFTLKLKGIDEAIHEVFETVGLYQILDKIHEVGI
jgi:anti-anti-sigma factor